MSSALDSVLPGSDLAAAASPEAQLAALRAALDAVDDELLALLFRRAALVAEVGVSAAKGRVKLRPGREAAILRRLTARRDAPLPAQAIVRIWRELLSATTALQGPFSVAVCEPASDAGYVACAREHFGALTPLRVHRTPAQAIGEVSAATASVALLPSPAEDAPSSAWWTALLHQDEPRIHVIARLPFWAPRPEGAPQVQALVVGAIPPDASGEDRSLLGLEIPSGTSRARLAADLGAAGLPAEKLLLRREPGAIVAQGIAEIDGFITDTDPRLATIAGVLHPPVLLGAYAVPLAGSRP